MNNTGCTKQQKAATITKQYRLVAIYWLEETGPTITVSI